MAKSDLLKEAIADAKAVKETALANAKIALQEAFAPRLERMLATKLTNEIEGDEEEMMAGAEEMEAGAEEVQAGAEEMEANMDMPDMVGVGLDFDNDGEYDLEGDLGAGEEEVAGEEEAPAETPEMNPEEMDAEYNEGYESDERDLDLESIIRELEGDLDDDNNMVEGEEVDMDLVKAAANSTIDEDYHEADDFEQSIDEIIESILREEEDVDMDVEMTDEEEPVEEGEMEAMKNELEEAYATVNQLKSILSEVNLLNAKLLYTNKLFRNFELSEGQKMKVIENFDRAGNTREVKLVFTTLAESFNRPTKKRVVKESYASKPAASTAPSKETTQVLSEGFELANRWKKLAGLL